MIKGQEQVSWYKGAKGLACIKLGWTGTAGEKIKMMVMRNQSKLLKYKKVSIIENGKKGRNIPECRGD